MRTHVSHAHPWTCKITLDYHRCPACGYIVESRDEYEKRNARYEKSLSCPRCHHLFVAYQTQQPLPY